MNLESILSIVVLFLWNDEQNMTTMISSMEFPSMSSIQTWRIDMLDLGTPHSIFLIM